MRSLGVAATALALSLALSGCETREAGAAATVGDTRISVSEVQNAYADIVPLVGQDQAITQGDILNLLILRPYLLQAAASAGRGISLDDARQDIKAVGSSDTTKLSPAGLRVWQANLANAALQRDQPQTQIRATYNRIGQQLRSAGVHINPRYGAGIDYANFSITPEQANWLKTPDPAAVAPTAPPQAPAEQPTGPGEEPAPTASDLPAPEATPTP
jgi:hypothetical protein